MDIIVLPIIYVLLAAISLYKFLVIAHIIMSWLLNFGIINQMNPLVNMVSTFLFLIVEPSLNPIRRLLPPLGGLDLSPVALFFILQALQIMLQRIMIRFI